MIYLNNAATSFPKPPSVIEAMMTAMKNPPVSPLVLFVAMHKGVIY